MTTKPCQLLFDGDLFLYRAAAASEVEADWGDDVWVLSTNLQQAKDIFKGLLKEVCDTLKSDDFAIIMSGSKNFRYEVDPNYKSNRKGTRKPLGFPVLKEWLHEEFPGKVKLKDCLEADDYLGILATTPGSVERVIVSEDKDFQSVPCKLYRRGELMTISKEQADRYWMLQTLTGDPADGYKGCPGIGPVKAEEILKKPGDVWENVSQAYRKAGLTIDDALQQARLARILRFEDWDQESQSVKLWTPDLP